MNKKNPQADQRRQKKESLKAKARVKKLKQADLTRQAQVRSVAEAKKNWPPEKEFPAAEHLFWIQHGANYIVSDAKEGIWKPLFPLIYDGLTTMPEAIAKTILGAGSNDDTHEALAWSAQPRLVIYTFRQRCIARMRTVKGKDLPLDVVMEMVKQPHDPTVWSVFDDLKASLKEKREARMTPGERLIRSANQALAFAQEATTITPEVIQDAAAQIENNPAWGKSTPDELSEDKRVLSIMDAVGG